MKNSPALDMVLRSEAEAERDRLKAEVAELVGHLERILPYLKSGTDLARALIAKHGGK